MGVFIMCKRPRYRAMLNVRGATSMSSGLVLTDQCNYSEALAGKGYLTSQAMELAAYRHGDNSSRAKPVCNECGVRRHVSDRTRLVTPKHEIILRQSAVTGSSIRTQTFDPILSQWTTRVRRRESDHRKSCLYGQAFGQEAGC